VATLPMAAIGEAEWHSPPRFATVMFVSALSPQAKETESMNRKMLLRAAL